MIESGQIYLTHRRNEWLREKRTVTQSMVGIRRGYDRVGEGEMSKTENENEKGGQKRTECISKHLWFDKFPWICQKALSYYCPPTGSSSHVKIFFFCFCFRCGCCRRCVIVVGHLFLSMVFFYSSCPLLFWRFEKRAQIVGFEVSRLGKW